MSPFSETVLLLAKITRECYGAKGPIAPTAKTLEESYDLLRRLQREQKERSRWERREQEILRVFGN